MPAAPIPKDESTRLAALKSCSILDTPPEAGFDDIVLLASQIAGTPVALVSLVDTDRQWFKAKVGMPMDATPREISFCAHAILQDEPLVVPDAREDARFADNPLVANGLYFYAGVPIRLEGGAAIGTLCVLDFQPRSLSDGQLRSLEALARQIARELQSRRSMPESSPPPDTHKALEPGTVVGKWRVQRYVGKGAFGAVFEAKNDAGERAALKVLTLQANLDRFVQEAQILKRLESPHVAKLLDVGNLPESHGECPYIALEYVDGTDLARMVDDRGKIPWQQAANWIADACEGIGGAHALGVIHRDIKPANIMLTGEQVKVIDFGVAKMIEPSAGSAGLTKADMVLGSPHYMSPEQLLSSKTVDARSDVWSMGVTLFELVAGTVPFQGANEIEVVAGVLSRPPPALSDVVPDIPRDLEVLVSRCLSRAQDDRPGSMTKLAAELRALTAPGSRP